MAKETTTETAPATPTPQDFLEALRLMIDSQQRTADQIASQTGEAIAQASLKTRQWWNYEDDPQISHLNPLGEKAHPRPSFVRPIFLLNYLCDENQHTAAEIELFNQLQPGEYPLRGPNGDIEQYKFWKIREREPGIPGCALMIEFPCRDTKDRMALARLDRGRGAMDMLEQMLPSKWTQPTPVG